MKNIELSVMGILDEGQEISGIEVIAVTDWEHYSADHDGLDECSHVALVTLVTGEHEGMPLTPDGEVVGWWEPFMG